MIIETVAIVVVWLCGAIIAAIIGIATMRGRPRTADHDRSPPVITEREAEELINTDPTEWIFEGELTALRQWQVVHKRSPSDALGERLRSGLLGHDLPCWCDGPGVACPAHGDYAGVIPGRSPYVLREQAEKCDDCTHIEVRRLCQPEPEIHLGQLCEKHQEAR